ncbi:hypothetical protein SPONL_2127 [uncultured Candidatus Thioglobus sp.]|nr:hypothetical protein SPONL_2127 [uncultured Candidatus Thioglobus sp.]
MHLTLCDKPLQLFVHSLKIGAEQAVNERIAQALVHLDDPDILLDLRKLNGKVKNTAFDHFWEELQLYLDELNPAVDERRHSAVLHMPIAISIRHLREIISDRLSSKFPGEEKGIPSLEWIRYQFWPRNPYSSSALRYTGKFDVKFGIQCRQMRKSHSDAHYVNALLQYAKGFCVKFRDFCQYVSADDKAIIPIGEPDLPISTGVRGHNRSIVPTHGSKLEALDHDFHIHGVVPSVALFVDIPDDVHGNFYAGSTFVTCKDKVTQASSALRHVTELMSIITTHFSTDGLQSTAPILVLVTDGGPDHRITFASVKISLLALFLGLNLDMLIAVRTCPYQSWTNLVERVMSTLNLALQNMSLARKKMPDEAEASVKGKNTLTDIRAEIERSTDLKDELRDSMSHPMILLAKQFSAMKLKGQPLRSGVAATDQEIDAMFERVRVIEPGLTASNLTKDVIEASPPLQLFLKTHSHSSHYVFQLKKCTSETCCFCSDHKICLPSDIFSSLSWLPLPLLDSTKEHYQSFDTIYGQEVSGKDRPSLMGDWVDADAVTADASNKDLFNATKVRDVIRCQECHKPRCIFSKSKLSLVDKCIVERVKDSSLFTCGCGLFHKSSSFFETIVVRQKISCTAPMEAQYFSSKLVSFPPVCYYCGCPEEMLSTDPAIAQLKEEYSVVRPICFLCVSSGKKVYTSHPSNMAKRRKKN